MPSSLLFAINNEGRVHTLSTSKTVWNKLPYGGQEFKKLSTVPHFVWALGGDHQIYVYVYGLDIPIRVKEESYENERWLPIEGFSSRLLPTDRSRFSSADGTVDRLIEKIRLPSMAWQWEGDWQLELTLNGQPLDHNGWTYAVDFPMQYHPKKQWKSCVRRRLWVRSRRYSAMDSWCAIAPLHEDATTEPFIDVSIGGQSVQGAESRTMLVWAVTSNNRVMFRKDVSTKLPEGSKWTAVPVPSGCEVSQISVGATGLVWAALIDGRALVRLGVKRDCLVGESWVEIRGPAESLRISHLSVGTNAVWAVTQHKQVWFRKGVKGEAAGISEESAAGCGWVEMVGKMSMVSVSGNDQVFGIGAEDRAVYFRIGVTSADLTGKRWRMLQAPLPVSRTSSNASLNRDKFNRSCNLLNQRPHSISEANTDLTNWEEQSHSAPTAPRSLPVTDVTGKHFETQLKNPKAWSPVKSVGSVVGMEAHPEMDQSAWQEDSDSSIGLFYGDDDELCWAECGGACWSWVEAGGCTVDANGQLPNWFGEVGCVNHAELQQPWRLQILKGLKDRLSSDEQFDDYGAAVETTSWVHTTEARINLNRSAFVECVIQLEWAHENGSLTILNPDGATTMHQFSLSEIVCVQCCNEPGNPRLTVHTPFLNPSFIKIQFASDTQLEEWQGQLANICNQIHVTNGKLKEDSIWATTILGDVFVANTEQMIASQLQNDMYVREFDLGGAKLPAHIPIHGPFTPGSEIKLFGCVADDAERIAFNLEAHSNYKAKHKAYVELENCCLHFNPRFDDNVVVLNTMTDNCWGVEDRVKDVPLRPGQEFVINILCTESDYVIFVNEIKFSTFKHRLDPYSVCGVKVSGQLQPFKLVIKNKALMLDPKSLYWRQIGGHLKRVESCCLGVTWGIAYDQTAWVYNGGWGGGFLGSMESSNINPMTDSQDYRVYENQRWNPVTGYTSAGLPTDRHMWSDASGKQKRTRDQIKLLSMHWQWVSEWLVDFHVRGGADREGWQYAIDFPSTYHANKQFTDYVRRRRWYRRCAIATTGPWQELGHTKLLDVCLEAIEPTAESSIAGTKWEHVNSDTTLCSLSCGPYKQVWAIGTNGYAYWRLGITSEKLEGDSWVCVEPPSGAQLKQISVGGIGVWALDSLGRLQVRKETSPIFPEGTHWQCINVDPSIINSAPQTSCFKHVSVGNKSVWATTDGGALVRRCGISPSNSSGTGWEIGISGNFQCVTAKSFA